MRARPWREIIGLAVVLLALGVVTAQRPAPAPEVPFSSFEAGDHGVRAWYELLARERVPVDRFESRAEQLADAHIGTLIVVAGEGFGALLGAGSLRGHAAALQRFVEAGGTLVAAGAIDDARTMTVLHLPSVRPLVKLGPHALRAVDVDLRAAGIRSIDVTTGDRFAAAKGARVLLADGAGAYALALRRGRGTVIELIDATALENVAIGRPDNARLAYALATFGAHPGRVAFDERLHGFTTERAWYTLLTPAQRAGLAVAACALLLLGIARGVRLGLPARAEPPPAPTSAAFVHALGALYARANAHDALAIRVARSTTALLAARWRTGDASDAILARLPDEQRERFARMASYASQRAGARGLRAVVTDALILLGAAPASSAKGAPHARNGSGPPAS